MVLMSDRGTALATVLASSLDWHDCLAGRGSDRLLQLELAKHGFGEADLHGCINFFSKVGINADSRASLTFVPDHASAGDTVTVRADQDLVVFVSTAPHPLASSASPAGVAVRIEAVGELGDPADLREEAVRALEVTRGMLV
jgi:uncharacterized protein YcgI (DUF1989 family)